jgi:hypothetical protein
LGLRHPLDQRLDTMSHPAFCNKAGSALSLKQLAAHHLGMAIQVVGAAAHMVAAEGRGDAAHT